KPMDPARFERHSDGRAIRVGQKRFLILVGESDETVDSWISAYEGEVQAPDADSDPMQDRLEALRTEGLLTEEEVERLRSQRENSERGDRLAALREQGLLSDDEVRLLGGSVPAPPVRQAPARQYPQYSTAPQGASTSTNGFAIASFVLSLVCASLLAIIFGHIALSQIERRREGGRGLAMAGLIIGYISLGITIIWLFTVIGAASTVDYDY
ncbi:MAG: DUF4190 domain-containing protein, partial [Actinomycetota bacterium]